jgi:type IV secretory pathway TraG/TraD family ATPase VirD4
MPSVLEHRQVVYFWLPAAIESVSVREIGKLALYTLLSAAIGRQQERQPHRQAYLVIDEFQRIAGENFKIILEQARSFGIGAILANQTQSDLRTTDLDLRPTINTNCRFRQYFSVSDPNEVNELSIMSGEELSTPKGWSQSGTSGSGGSSSSNGASQNESIKHRLTSNDIIRISDHPLDSIVLVSRGEGYTQYSGFPVPVRTTWPISLAVYKERQKMQWPTRDEYDEDATVISGKNPSDIENSREAAIAQLMTDQLALAFEKKVNTGA